jgi:hypothetical protein
MSEADLIWIGGFAESLRQLSPDFAADGQGEVVDALARQALEQDALRALAPDRAAAQWWERHIQSQ